MKFKKNEIIATVDTDAVKQSVKGAIQKKTTPEKGKSNGLFGHFSSWLPGKNKDEALGEGELNNDDSKNVILEADAEDSQNPISDISGLSAEERELISRLRKSNTIPDLQDIPSQDVLSGTQITTLEQSENKTLPPFTEQEKPQDQSPSTENPSLNSSIMNKFVKDFNYEQLAMWLVGNSDFLYNLRQTLLKDVTEKVTQTITENYHFITKEKYDTTIKNYDKIHSHIRELVIEANNRVTAIEELDQKIEIKNNIISEQDMTIANKTDNIQKLTSTQQDYIEANKRLSADIRDGEKLKRTLVSANESIKQEIEIGTKVLATEAEKIVDAATKKISDNAKIQATTLASLAQQYAEMLAQNDSESSEQLMQKMKLLLANSETAIKEYQNTVNQTTEDSNSGNDTQAMKSISTELEKEETKSAIINPLINENEENNHTDLQEQNTPEEFN